MALPGGAIARITTPGGDHERGCDRWPSLLVGPCAAGGNAREMRHPVHLVRDRAHRLVLSSIMKMKEASGIRSLSGCVAVAIFLSLAWANDAFPSPAGSADGIGPHEAGYSRAAAGRVVSVGKHRGHRRRTRMGIASRIAVNPAGPASPSHPPTAPIPIDGPICPGWGISIPCRCPQVPTIPGPPQSVPSGDGWVEVELSYPTAGFASCPGGISVVDSNRTAVASAGHTTGPTEGGPGVESGSTTIFVLPAGVWTAVARAGPEDAETEGFVIVAGQGTKVTFSLSS